MALIRLHPDQPGPVARRGLPARHVEIGVAGLVAVGEAARSVDLPPPPDLLRGEGERQLALIDLTTDVEQARVELTRRGVLTDGAPSPAIAADLRALAGSPCRLRMSLAGGGRDLIGYWWTDGRVAGSVVRDGPRCHLGAFEAGGLASELLDPLPDPPAPTGSGLTVPVDAFPVLAALDAVPAGTEDLVAAATGVSASTVQEIARWSAGVEAVLVVSTVPSRPEEPSRVVVWFLRRSGWWSARLSRVDGRRVAVLQPASRHELAGWVAEMTVGRWR